MTSRSHHIVKLSLINVNGNGQIYTTLDSRPVPIRDRRVRDRGSSGTHGRVVAWSSVRATRTVERSGETFEEGSEPIGAMALVAIVPGSPWETSNNTLLAHDSLHSDPLLTRNPFFERPAPSSFHPCSVHSPRLYDGQSMVVDISIPTSLAFAYRWQLLRRSQDTVAVHVID